MFPPAERHPSRPSLDNHPENRKSAHVSASFPRLIAELLQLGVLGFGLLVDEDGRDLRLSRLLGIADNGYERAGTIGVEIRSFLAATHCSLGSLG